MTFRPISAHNQHYHITRTHLFHLPKGNSKLNHIKEACRSLHLKRRENCKNLRYVNIKMWQCSRYKSFSFVSSAQWPVEYYWRGLNNSHEGDTAFHHQTVVQEKKQTGQLKSNFLAEELNSKRFSSYKYAKHAEERADP